MKEHKEKPSKDSREHKSAFKEPSRDHNKSSESEMGGLLLGAFLSCCPLVIVSKLLSGFGSFDMGFGSLKAILGTIFSSFSGLFSLGFLEDSLEDLL